MLWKNVVFRNYYLAAFILCFIVAAGILATKSFLPPVIPLFYGKPMGADQLASNLYMFIVPAVALLITVINLILSSITNSDFVKKTLAIFSFIISVLAAITIFKIILLVGFF